jgi:hypothetical protein
MSSRAAVVAISIVLSTTAQEASPVAVPEHVRDPVLNLALGIECSHCHVEGRPDDTSKPAMATARKMVQMVLALNDQLKGRGRVGCETCHGGAVRPARLPRPELDVVLARWPTGLEAPESVKLTMSVYSASLGVGCDHCHTSDWKSSEKTTFRTVALMSSLFPTFAEYMPASARTQCYMCHKGSIRPGTVR